MFNFFSSKKPKPKTKVLAIHLTNAERTELVSTIEFIRRKLRKQLAKEYDNSKVYENIADSLTLDRVLRWLNRE